ncbi:UDP-N-acetylglucosamine--N-acetylmuramyl-(pentapeptide) pyrophosphoryl-undecaprenol N-acetylglucosamine transferase [Patescibacteria group bacterium]|nr:UDP-N-acetylglucosamine--N-acetylmuramyl-(pentapeptide) pyrophosphoryl-undecaprenol N-acetylglucosamine transferase [Patescibacteria group bacterium]
MKKIFITGGHFAPAKAVMAKMPKDWQIFYLGRKYAMEDDKALALEYQEIGNLSNLRNLRYLSITTGRLQRKFFVNVGQSIRSLLKIPVGFIQSLYWVLRYQPAVVLSFGGYVAVPVVISAWLWDVPIATHEQTKSVGLANRIIRIFGAKVLDTGNPIREEVLKASSVKDKASRTIYITGGNQGAHVINTAVAEIIEELVEKYKVIHQTGDSMYKDFEKAKELKNYVVKKFLNGEESAQTLADARIVVSRAGANTIEEIAFLGKPAILIPIPWSSGGEQQKNAETLANLGMAEIIRQEKLSGETLLETINKIEKNYSVYSENAKKGKTLVHPDAAEKIVEEIEKLT